MAKLERQKWIVRLLDFLHQWLLESTEGQWYYRVYSGKPRASHIQGQHFQLSWVPRFKTFKTQSYAVRIGATKLGLSFFFSSTKGSGRGLTPQTSLNIIPEPGCLEASAVCSVLHLGASLPLGLKGETQVAFLSFQRVLTFYEWVPASTFVVLLFLGQSLFPTGILDVGFWPIQRV